MVKVLSALAVIAFLAVLVTGSGPLLLVSLVLAGLSLAGLVVLGSASRWP